MELIFSSDVLDFVGRLFTHCLVLNVGVTQDRYKYSNMTANKNYIK